MRQREKWEDFFSSDYLRFIGSILTEQRTAVEVEQIIQLMDLPIGSRILDLGCGQGRIAIPLAQRGFRVTGYDGSAPLLAEAKRKARESGVNIRFVEGDMRDLPFENEFDAILNLGTAFGYINDEREDQHILNQVGAALRGKGIFIQDTENRELKLQNQMGARHHRMGQYIVNSYRSFNIMTSRWHEVMTWNEGERLREAVLDLRLYTATELCSMIRNARLCIKGVYGGLDLSELTMESERLVIISCKEG